MTATTVLVSILAAVVAGGLVFIAGIGLGARLEAAKMMRYIRSVEEALRRAAFARSEAQEKLYRYHRTAFRLAELIQGDRNAYERGFTGAPAQTDELLRIVDVLHAVEMVREKTGSICPIGGSGTADAPNS